MALRTCSDERDWPAYNVEARRLYDAGRAASIAKADILSTNCGTVVSLGTEDPRSERVDRILVSTVFGSSSSATLTPHTIDHSSACRELDEAPNSFSIQ